MNGNKFHIAGDDYYHGRNGKEQDEEKAVECWLKGAELGNVQCMKNLSWAYLHGRGVKGNALQSGHWGNMAIKTVRANHSNNLSGQEGERVIIL
jgi:TPR repeat protein